MITSEDIRKIIDKLPISAANLSKDVSRIICCTDVFEYGDVAVTKRHIDIEFSFGDFYEVWEDDPLFRYICTVSDITLPLMGQENIIIYKV